MFSRQMEGAESVAVVGIGGRKLGMQRRQRRVIVGARPGAEAVIGACCKAECGISGAREQLEHLTTTK